jgi:methylthioribulose-1-phosphate dehydratase
LVLYAKWVQKVKNQHLLQPVVVVSTMTSTSASTKAPGAGWSNGSMPQSMFPLSRNGKLALYSHNRRWIGLHQSWTRIGSGSEFDARHSSSATSGSLAESPEQEAEAVKALIAQLCEQFYRNGWATGTGGGVSIRIPATDSGDYRVFVAPSGIQKEDMIGEDVFELNMEREVVVAPKTPNLRQSACTPLWYVVYKHRPSSMCVIHTHSLNAQMATLLNEDSSVLRITHLEMLKGVGNHAYDDILEIPIIDNRPSEDLLAEQLEQAIQLYPKCNAVLVRRHGLYVSIHVNLLGFEMSWSIML